MAAVGRIAARAASNIGSTAAEPGRHNFVRAPGENFQPRARLVASGEGAQRYAYRGGSGTARSVVAAGALAVPCAVGGGACIAEVVRAGLGNIPYWPRASVV